MVRRMLLILVTGLIVARPFIVAGEDPTLEAPLQNLDTSGLLLTMLWFVAAVLWGLWRLWARNGTWYGGLLEAALFGVVLLTFAGAALVAPYKHAAWLMAWEWLAMVLGFFLVRQLAVSREEQHCFFGVLLAGLVVLSVYALYQRGVEIPQLQHKYANRESLRKVEEERSGMPLDDAALDAEWQRAQQNWVYGTYANPNSFAGYLALLIPGAVGAALLCARHKHPRWQVMLASAFATLAVVALVLTSSRGAILASLATTLGVVAFVWRDRLRAHWPYGLAVLAALALLAFGVWKSPLWTAGLGKTEGTAAVRLLYWRATGKMIAAHPWSGVGPGQFGRYYPRYMDPAAGETIRDPHNFVLEIWATCGVFTLITLLIALALWYRRVARVLFGAPTVDGPGDVPPLEVVPGEPLPVRWEFYVGGMFGLLLAFVLRVVDLPPDEIVLETVKAGVAAVLWFGAFALYEQIRWSDRARLLVLVAGVTALLLNLLVSGGINAPSVAGLLWCAAALALNAADRTPNAWGIRFKPLLYIPLPLFAAVAVVYLLYVFYPITSVVHLMRRTTAELTRNDSLARGERPLGGISHRILGEPALIDPLEKAWREEDPGNAPLCCYIANLESALWVRRGDYNITNDNQRLETRALNYAAAAETLDPEGGEGYYTEYGLRRMFAASREMPDRLPALYGLGARIFQITANRRNQNYEKYMTERKEQYGYAAEALLKYWPRDPNNARLNYLLADSLYRADKPVQAHEYAERALRLAQVNNYPTRTLTNGQRKQLEQRLAADGGS